MTRHLERDLVATKAKVHETIPGRHEVDRTFELPPFAYAATVGLYFGFLGVVTAGFGNPGLIIPLAICAIIVVAGFGVPTLWTRMAPASRKHAMTWGRFQGQGIATLTGRLTAGEAMAQVLVLPVLIFLWGLAVVTIAALV